jgi:hypothetical protein
MAKKAIDNGELIKAQIAGFNYEIIKDSKVVARLQKTADEIKQRMKRTLEDVIENGTALSEVKDSLEHGQFEAWVKGEFGLAKRTAELWMSVAERFGAKSATFAHLPIQPSAAYLLASPGVPEKAFKSAIKQAEEGETITLNVAKKIRAEAMGKPKSRRKMTTQKMALKLRGILEQYREMWKPGDLPKLARLLREHADEIAPRQARKKPTK